VIPCVEHVHIVRTLRAADVAGRIVGALALEDQVVRMAAAVAGGVVHAIALEDEVVGAMAAADVADGVVGALALEDDIVRAVAAVDMAERIVRSADDLATIEHCTDQPGLTTLQRGNIVTVVLEADAAVRAAGQLSDKRDVMSNSACGVCGRATLESMRADLAPLPAHARVPADVIAGLPMRLRERQPLFERTGGLHAAGIFTWTGELLASAEDVGRHNAVDKVIGTMLLRDAIPLETSALCVSGRTSYEIVQKAWCAGIPLVVATALNAGNCLESLTTGFLLSRSGTT